jgi:hypothetical protein
MSSSQQQQQQREKADDEHQPLNKPCRHHRHRQTIPNLIQFRDSFERTDFCLFSKSKSKYNINTNKLLRSFDGAECLYLLVSPGFLF